MSDHFAVHRISGAAERRSASKAGSLSVARAHTEHSARRRALLKDGLRASGYIGIVDNVTSSVRCNAPARVSKNASAFAGAEAGYSRDR